MSETSPLHTALRLGRVSNVPTVWTNVAAGLALTGAPLHPPLIILLGLAVSLFYVGGMYLNDAFDAGWDRQHRPERPIPSGLVRARTVYLAGFAMLAAGLVIVACGTTTRPPLYAAVLLCLLIVLYDLSHKGNPLSPLIMALCRVSVYALAALSVSPLPLPTRGLPRRGRPLPVPGLPQHPRPEGDLAPAPAPDDRQPGGGHRAARRRSAAGDRPRAGLCAGGRRVLSHAPPAALRAREAERRSAAEQVRQHEVLDLGRLDLGSGGKTISLAADEQRSVVGVVGGPAV